MSAVFNDGLSLIGVRRMMEGVIPPILCTASPDRVPNASYLSLCEYVDPLHIAWTMNVSASLVDLSSLSTVGALYIAGMPPGTDARRLFNALLAWGMSMTVVGAIGCYLFF